MFLLTIKSPLWKFKKEFYSKIMDVFAVDWNSLVIRFLGFWAQVFVLSIGTGLILPSLIHEYKKAFASKNIKLQRYACIKLAFLAFLFVGWAVMARKY